MKSKAKRPVDKPPLQAFEDIEMDVITETDDGANAYMVHIEAKAVWSHLDKPVRRGFPPMKKLAKAMAEGLARVLPKDSEVEFVVCSRKRGVFDSVRGKKKRN